MPEGLCHEGEGLEVLEVHMGTHFRQRAPHSSAERNQ